ncbi:MAG: uncharacterized protein JWM74_5903 [Myxococcaceae bacterium]|nr:uncharacterized protein [Myxococcaceae bacterium]
MTAKKPLAASVLAPGFTPSVRDAAGVVALLASEEEDVARGAGHSLERLGPQLLPLASDLAASAPLAARPLLCRVVGVVGASLEDAPRAEAVTFVIAQLTNDDARTRRAAATALGKLGGPEAEAALLDAAKKEEAPPERRAILAALGKIGTAAALELLAAIDVGTVHDAELKKIVSRAKLMIGRTSMRANPSSIDLSRSSNADVPLVFFCRSGLAPVLSDELDALALPGGGTWMARPDTDDPTVVRAALRAGWPLARAFGARTALEIGFPLPEQKIGAGEDVVDAVVRALGSPAARAIFSTWTRGPVRYRVAWSQGGHRRAAVWSIAQRVQEIDPALVNDPTDTTWEARVVEMPEDAPVAVEVILVPRAITDPRFLYRERDVPAASHPTIAAALARIAGVRADDVVWDPFVGSGTELVERARLGPYAELHGSDRDPNALEAARTNLRAARVEASLVHADALKHAPEGVTLILTNPPMGRRVLKRSEAGDLAEQMVSRASEVLAPGGRLVWISPAVGRTERRAKNVGLVVEMNHDVDMGGFTAAIQVLRRPAHTGTKPKGMR